MNLKLIPLDCDDVILFANDAYKVSRLKEIIERQIRGKLQRRMYESSSLEPGASMLEFLSQISLGKQVINLMEVQHHYMIHCQILKVGSQGWERGKLRIEVCTSPINSHLNQIYLEFAPEEIVEYDPLLEEICKIIQSEK
ncbi:KGK domain-containing protein [Calothrix sp. 336/3]|uniref:KGK domain-containing protein n=1 Tax=Calothrix sp. 336/3 TaxID=1337936 RepID=UPI0004E428BC|nr:KGK domain-containing protein [Calothrix sp. 336/3]AKG22376.1 KGK family protein [Calothrix sp. 336/3]